MAVTNGAQKLEASARIALTCKRQSVHSVSEQPLPGGTVRTDLTAADVERVHYLLGALRASLMLCEDGDVGAFTSDLRAAFFANLASMATSAHAIVSHVYVRED